MPIKYKKISIVLFFAFFSFVNQALCADGLERVRSDIEEVLSAKKSLLSNIYVKILKYKDMQQDELVDFIEEITVFSGSFYSKSIDDLIVSLQCGVRKTLEDHNIFSKNLLKKIDGTISLNANLFQFSLFSSNSSDEIDSQNDRTLINFYLYALKELEYVKAIEKSEKSQINRKKIKKKRRQKRNARKKQVAIHSAQEDEVYFKIAETYSNEELIEVILNIIESHMSIAGKSIIKEFREASFKKRVKLIQPTDGKFKQALSKLENKLDEFKSNHPDLLNAQLIELRRSASRLKFFTSAPDFLRPNWVYSPERMTDPDCTERLYEAIKLEKSLRELKEIERALDQLFLEAQDLEQLKKVPANNNNEKDSQLDQEEILELIIEDERVEAEQILETTTRVVQDDFEASQIEEEFKNLDDEEQFPQQIEIEEENYFVGANNNNNNNVTTTLSSEQLKVINKAKNFKKKIKNIYWQLLAREHLHHSLTFQDLMSVVRAFGGEDFSKKGGSHFTFKVPDHWTVLLVRPHGKARDNKNLSGSNVGLFIENLERIGLMSEEFLSHF